jgi:hypothetical protein
MARFADYVASLSPAFWVRGSGGTPFAQVGSHPVKHQAGTGVAPDILADGPLGGGQATGSMDFAGAQWVRYGTGAVDLGDKEAFTVLAWIKEKPGVWQGEQTIVDNGYASILLRTLDGSPHLAKAQLNGGYFGPFDLPGLDGGGTPVLLDGQFHMVGAKGSTSPAVKRYSVLDGAVLAPISIPGKPWLENFDDPIGPITVGGNAAVPNIPGDVTILANMQIAEVVRFDRELTVGELAKLQQAATGAAVAYDPISFPPIRAAKTTTGLTLTWGGAWGGPPGTIGLALQRLIGGTWTASAATVTGLAPGTLYPFRLRGEDAQGGVTFSAPTEIRTAYVVQDPFPSEVRVLDSGRSLYIRMQDFEHQPAVLTAIASHPAISIDGGNPIPLSNPIWGIHPASGQHRLPYVVYPLASAIPDGATVAVSAPAGWCTAAGQPAQAMAAVAAARGPLLPDVADMPKTMELGINVVNPLEYGPTVIFADLMKQSSPYHGAPEVDGYPTSMGGNASLTSTVSMPVVNGVDDKGWPNLPDFGIYTLMWKGAADRELRPFDWPTVVTQVGGETSEGGWRVKRYNVTFDRDHASTAYLAVRTFGHAFTAERLYDPSIPDPIAYANADYSDPARAHMEFHPRHLAQLGSPRNIRFMDGHSTNNSSRSRIEHYTPRHHRSYSGTNSRVFGHVPIVKIEDHAVQEGYYRRYTNDEGQKWARLKVTTAAPHGYRTGQTVTLSCPDGSQYGVHLPTTTGHDVPVHAGSERQVFVLSPTEFVHDYAGWKTGSIPQAYTAAAGDLGPSPSCYIAIQNDYPIESSINLCNVTGADAYICVPHLMTDASEVARLVAKFADPATGLRPGLRLMVESSNEVWNFGPAFSQTHWYDQMGHSLGFPSLRHFYAKVASDAHAAAMAEWTARGRAASELVRIIATQGGYPGYPTAAAVDWLTANNRPFDMLVVGIYMSNRPEWWSPEAYHGIPVAIFDAMGPEQLMDLWEVHFLHGELERYATGHIPLLEAYAHATGFPRPTLGCYEGGPEKCLPNWTPPTTEAEANIFGRRLRETAWHPRFRRCWSWHLQNLQDRGQVVMMADYLHAHGGDRETHGGFQIRCQMWGIYRGWMLPGRGDGSDGLNDNRVALEDYGRIVSPQGPRQPPVAGSLRARVPDPIFATGVTLTGPSTAIVGVPITLTATLIPPGSVVKTATTVALNDGGAGGVFNPRH